MDSEIRPLYDRLTGQSEVARELTLLDRKLRSQLGISDAMVLLADLIIAAARLLIDDSDPRQWHERLGDLDPYVNALQTTAPELAQTLDALATDPSSVAQRIQQPNFTRFLRRLLGAATYDRLSTALKGDGAVLAVGVRRGIRALMPLALALDDCVALVKPGQLARVNGWSALNLSLLKSILAADRAIDQVVNLGLPLEDVPVREDELTPLASDVVDEVEAIAGQLHEVLEGKSREALLDLSHRLNRKVQGARDVLDTSADGVSQAANSLVEFIDRLLRTSFNDKEVVKWIRANRVADSGELVYQDAASGHERPTKRGQALAFVYGGQPYEEARVFAELSALGIAATRDVLQKLKHADEGTDEERLQMRTAISAVEGFIVFAIQACWPSVPVDALDIIRGRFEATTS